MSARTLQRKLVSCGNTYMDILEETRRDLGLAYLSVPQYSVNDVTFLLGFSATSSFSRAFRRWTGLSPSAWRAQLRDRVRLVKTQLLPGWEAPSGLPLSASRYL